jgi:hypothetical protein
VHFRGVGISCVVVDGANHHASCPRRDASERAPFEISAIISRFHVFHFAGMPSGNPFRKMFEFGGIGSRSNARKIKTGLLGCPLDDGF